MFLEKNISIGYQEFGSTMPGRSFSSDSYRFGFNSMEKDDEVYGVTGSSYDFGARMYNSRIGKWLAIDPQARKYSFASPYNFTLNNPIWFVDPNGEDVTFHGKDAGAVVTEIKKVSSLDLSIDADGKLSVNLPKGPILFSIAGLSKIEIAFVTAINDDKINVNLYTTDAEKFDSKDGTKNIPILVGGFDGSEIINGKVETTQIFNLDQSKKVEKAGMSTAGTDALHETVESYSAGKNDAGGDYTSGFTKAHDETLKLDPKAQELYPNENSKTGAKGLTDGKGNTVDLVPKTTSKKFTKPK